MAYSDGYTGHLFEEEVLGCCLAAHRGYMRWHEAAETVCKNQPPRKTLTATALEREVARQAKVPARFFTAVRSTFDIAHGCDAFFEFAGTVVTLDLTMNPHKDSGKADVIVHADEVADIPALAGRIARELRSKCARRV